jgi:hypothetical protein
MPKADRIEDAINSVLSKTEVNAINSVLSKTEVKDHQAARIKLSVLMMTMKQVAERKRSPDRKPPKKLFALIIRLTNELVEAIDRLDEELDPSLASWFCYRAAALYDDDDDREFDLYEMRDRLEALADSCAQRPRPQKPPNRPRGSFQHPELRKLVSDLYKAIVTVGGGELTLSERDERATGTLPAALDILRHCLPEIIPRTVTYSTLRRILIAAAK